MGSCGFGVSGVGVEAYGLDNSLFKIQNVG